MVALVAILVPVAPVAGQQQTKREVIVRAAEICKHGREAMAIHVRRAGRALEQRMWNTYARHGRRFARVGLRHVRRLNGLRPPPGRYWYDRYVDRARSTLGWVDVAMDAFAEDRFMVARRRTRSAERHRSRAEKAARKYGLRRSCVRFLQA